MNPMQAKTAAVRYVVSTEEWQARVDLAAAYRLAKLYEWDDLIFTHIHSSNLPDSLLRIVTSFPVNT